MLGPAAWSIMNDKTRRRILQTAGATGAIALAGCIGGDDEETGGGGGGNGGTDASLENPEDLPEMEITFGHSGDTDITNHQHRAATTFKQHIEEATDGRFQVDVVPGGALGSLVEMTEQNIEGSIEVVGSTAEGHLAPFYPNINVYAVPYAFRDPEVANYVFDKEFGTTLWEDFRDQTGLRMLTWYDNGGFRSFGVTEEIRELDDMEGLRIRTMQIEAHQELVRQLGASPEPIDWTELYEAIDQGVVDGQENSIPTVISGNLHEVLDFIILDRHVFTMNFIHCNDDWFADLPTPYKRIVSEAGYLASQDARMVNRLGRERGVSVVEEEDVEVFDPPQDVIDDFAEATQEPVIDIIEDEMDDPALIDEMLDSIDRAEDELGYT